MNATNALQTFSFGGRYGGRTALDVDLRACRIGLATNLLRDGPRLSARLTQATAWATAVAALHDVRMRDLPAQRVRSSARGFEFLKARREYTDWVLAAQRESLAPDPLVTVGAADLLIETTSTDGRAYAAVVARSPALADVVSQVAGTTTCATDARLPRLLSRVRDYRTTTLEIGAYGLAAGLERSALERRVSLSALWRHGFVRTQRALACVAAADADWLGPVELAAPDIVLLTRAVAARLRRRGPRGLRFDLAPAVRVAVALEPRAVPTPLTSVWDGERATVRAWGRDVLTALAPLASSADRVRLWLSRTSGASVVVVDMRDVSFTLALAGGRTPLAAAAASPHSAVVESALRLASPSSAAQIAAHARMDLDAALASLVALATAGRVSVDAGTAQWRLRHWQQDVDYSTMEV